MSFLDTFPTVGQEMVFLPLLTRSQSYREGEKEKTVQGRDQYNLFRNVSPGDKKTQTSSYSCLTTVYSSFTAFLLSKDLERRFKNL